MSAIIVASVIFISIHDQNVNVMSAVVKRCTVLTALNASLIGLPVVYSITWVLFLKQVYMYMQLKTFYFFVGGYLKFPEILYTVFPPG